MISLEDIYQFVSLVLSFMGLVLLAIWRNKIYLDKQFNKMYAKMDDHKRETAGIKVELAKVTVKVDRLWIQDGHKSP